MVHGDPQANMTITQWWDRIYPHAVSLEKNITTSPSETDEEIAQSRLESLPQLHTQIETCPYPETATIMRDHLMRAVTYLIHAYEERLRQNVEESDFYYSSALMQVAQLHYQLVQHGFAD